MRTKDRQHYRLMVDGAKRYAAANNSDPFAYRRAVTHINNGIATYATSDGKQGFYDAEETTETRYLPTVDGKQGEAYQAVVFKNVSRV